MLKTLLLEDDSYIQAFLKRLLQDMAIDDVFVTDDALNAIQWSALEQPQLALMDIEIGSTGYTGLDVAQKIYENDPDCFIIFVTGYAEYCLESFAVHPYAYVLKPVNIDKFKHLIYEVQGKLAERQTLAQDTLAIKCGNEIIHVAKKDILFVEGRLRKTFVHTRAGILESRKNLDEFKNLLNEDFLQVHRSYLVNTKEIVKTIENSDRTYDIEFRDYPEKALLSRGFYAQYKDYFHL